MDTKHKLLIVEDLQVVVDVATAACMGFGYEVLSSDTVEGALELIDRNPDITDALVDGSLHVKGFCNTIPIVERLKEMGVRRIVAISGSGATQDELMEAGCTEELMKPFTMPEIMAFAGGKTPVRPQGVIKR